MNLRRVRFSLEVKTFLPLRHYPTSDEVHKILIEIYVNHINTAINEKINIFSKLSSTRAIGSPEVSASSFILRSVMRAPDIICRRIKAIFNYICGAAFLINFTFKLHLRCGLP